MIVDIHTHTFPDKIAARTVDKLQALSHTQPFTDGSTAALRASMAEAGVDCSVVQPVATNAQQVPRVNDASLALNERSGETGVLSFGCMHPDYDGWRDELSRLCAQGVRGIKLHPVYQGVYFDDPRYLRILDRCAELGLLVLIHAGRDVGLPDAADFVSPARIASAVRQTDGVTLICAHMGGWRQWDEVARVLPETGVYLDTSFSLGAMTPNGDGYYKTKEALSLLDDSAFLQLVRAFGTQRVLFGTDSPWGAQEESLRRFRALALTEEEKNAILGGNAERLLGL
ncbi:MAG: amidohydrolase family protein [Oscillospiraceae bacterium]|nr:amidohydrolase family protein [Oscillospiraceae bacterium]